MRQERLKIHPDALTDFPDGCGMFSRHHRSLKRFSVNRSSVNRIANDEVNGDFDVSLRNPKWTLSISTFLILYREQIPLILNILDILDILLINRIERGTCLHIPLPQNRYLLS